MMVIHMNKKFLTILFLLMAVSTIAVVSAQNTQLSGVEFNVPEGYTFDKDAISTLIQSLEDEKLSDLCVFKNSKGDTVLIMIYNKYPKNLVFPDDYKVENKTIHGKNGTFMSASSTNKVAFQYPEGDKYIVIQTMDEKVIDEFLK